ncbi:transcription elongation factor GreA [Malacoplasma penetrans]|uniref:Transcription elongation factor GreA n=1 Tax=Malacoplasma penetrans (strain HF-2) TaxID=272633 RepID=Q8EW38_MALP2|nr:transcription elongation factor GreA [Malacoplasma penetrans]RXY96378.1 transcription elongation factor GreA [Malacoplasma penetrans]BAC44158.1 transcription elongation factor GreA [Malacoplasma penetrans HF-2]
MAAKKNLMTESGKKELEKELKYLIDVRRPEIIKQIQEAREQGDLSENADYDAAKNFQAQIESRIKEIQNILNNTKIIKEEKSSGSNEKKVHVGATVTIKDYSDGESHTYKIVGPIESDPSQNKISNECPLAKCIMGKKVGEESYVKGIDHPYKVKVVDITN